MPHRAHVACTMHGKKTAFHVTMERWHYGLVHSVLTSEEAVMTDESRTAGAQIFTLYIKLVGGPNLHGFYCEGVLKKTLLKTLLAYTIVFWKHFSPTIFYFRKVFCPNFV